MAFNLTVTISVNRCLTQPLTDSEMFFASSSLWAEKPQIEPILLLKVFEYCTRFFEKNPLRLFSNSFDDGSDNWKFLICAFEGLHVDFMEILN